MRGNSAQSCQAGAVVFIIVMLVVLVIFLALGLVLGVHLAAGRVRAKWQKFN